MRQTPDSVRVPALDDGSVAAWLDDRRVILQPWDIHAPARAVDIQTGAKVPVPGHRRSPSRGWVEIEESYPQVSPDGRWMLYQEIDRGKEPRDFDAYLRQRTVHPARWRMYSLRDGKERRIPSDGRFPLQPVEEFVWLPDSDGWVGVAQERTRLDALLLYRLSRPERPTLLPRGEKYSRLVTVTQEGMATLLNSLRTHITQIPVSGGAARTLALEPLVLGGAKRDRAGIEQVVVPRRGQFAVARVQVLGPPLVTGGNGPSRWEFWRVPTTSGKAERLFVVERDVRAMEVTPDSASLIYWLHSDESIQQGKQTFWDGPLPAYRVPLR